MNRWHPGASNWGSPLGGHGPATTRRRPCCLKIDPNHRTEHHLLTLASVSSKTLFQNLLWEDIYIKLNLEPYCGWLYMSPVHLSLTVRVCLKYKTNVSIFLRNISLSKSLVSALYSKLYQDLVHYGVLKWKNELIKLKIISLSENFFSACLCLLLYEAPFILHCNHDHYGFLNWKNELIKTILHRARMNLVHCHQQHRNSSCARCVQDVRKICARCA